MALPLASLGLTLRCNLYLLRCKKSGGGVICILNSDAIFWLDLLSRILVLSWRGGRSMAMRAEVLGENYHGCPVMTGPGFRDAC
jgi:hypothetical protein